ncbi:hypothetical protein [Corynebacterium freiburgense]|uniref:hypothetical protein n=1 Tax=Corynebacterium freiburgense TaxID=556548 RepID=UPI0004042391|nr:hypothetical protein [Corynebacterium freiburgense]WJZ01365.1 hypothetical protein CFREI_00240 [Corynebacterium freiburgense]
MNRKSIYIVSVLFVLGFAGSCLSSAFGSGIAVTMLAVGIFTLAVVGSILPSLLAQH